MAYEISSSIAQGTVATQNVAGSSTNARASGGHFSPDGTRLAVPVLASFNGDKGIDIYTSSSASGWTKTDFCRSFEASAERHVIGVQWISNSEIATILDGRGVVTFGSSSSGWGNGQLRAANADIRSFVYNPSKTLLATYAPENAASTGKDYVDVYMSASTNWSFGYRIDHPGGSNKDVGSVAWLDDTDIAIGVPDHNGGFGANTDSGLVTIYRTTDGGDNFSFLEKVEGHIGDEHLGASIYYHTASGNIIVGGGKPTSNFADNVGGYKWYLYQSSSTGGYVQGVSDRTILTETGSASGRVPAHFYMQSNDASNRFAIALAASTATGTNGQVLVWESGSAEGWKASVIDDNVTLYYPGASYSSQVGLSVDGIVANNNNVTPDTGNKTFRVHTPTISAGDTTGPSITSVALTNIAHAAGAQNFYNQNGKYLKTNTRVDITVTFDEAVNVVTTGGTPTLAINIGGVSRAATYRGSLFGGSGTANIKFHYFLTSGETTDDDGISIDAGSISLNGGTMKDAAGNDATLSYSAVAANSNYKVDTTRPTITNVVMASDNSYATVTFSENVANGAFGFAPVPADFSLTLTGGNSSAINLNSTPSSVERDTPGSQTTYKVYLNGTDLDTNATGNETLVVDSVDDEIFDRAGNAHSVAHTGVSLNDTAGPSISSISFPDSSDNTKVKIVFNERVGRSNGSLWTSSNFPDSNNTYINFSSSNPLIKNFISTFDEYQSTNVANDTIVLDIAYDGDVQSGDKLNAQFFSNATNGIYDASGNFTAGTISASSDASFPTTGRVRTTFNRTFKVVNATTGSAFAYLSTDRDEGDFAFGSAVYGNRMVFLGSIAQGQTGSFTVDQEKHNDRFWNSTALSTYSLIVYNAAQDTTSFSPSSPSGAGKAQKNFNGLGFNGTESLNEPKLENDRRDWEITYQQDDTVNTQKRLSNWTITKTDSSVVDYFVGPANSKTQVSLVTQLDGTGSIRWDWGEKIRFPSHSEDGSDGFSSFRLSIATQNSHLSNNLSERIFNVSLDSSYEGDISNVRIGDLTFTTSSGGVTDGAWLLEFFYDGIANGTERIQVSYSGEPTSFQSNVRFYDSLFNSIQTVDALLDNFYTSWPIGTDRASFRIGLSQDALPTSKTETISTSGGVVKAGGTNADPTVTLTIPENAVSENTSIGINLDQDNNPRTNGVQYSSGLSGMESYSKVIEVTPHTNQFSQAVTLSFKLEGSAAGTKPSNLVIYKSLTRDGPWFKLPSHLYSCSDAGVVTLTATSFSRYHALGGNNMARTQINNAQIAKFVTPAKALVRALDLTGSLSSSAGANANKAAYLSATDLFIVHRTGSEAQPISASVMQDFFSSPDVPDAGDADNTNYKVVFSPGGNGANLLHDTELTYNPSTDLLSAGHITLNRADAAGDVAVNFAQGGTVAYAMGIDDSDSNTWKLHSAASLADSSDVSLSAAGVLTAANLVATTADINAGNIDATVIGDATPAAGTFTALVGTSLNLQEGNITNAGDINADSLSIDLAANGLKIDATGADNGTFDIIMNDDDADALSVKDSGGQDYLVFTSTNSAPLITFSANPTFAGRTIPNLGTVSAATSITSTAFVGPLDGVIGGSNPAAGSFTAVTVADEIIHAGDVDNKIVFGADTQSFETGGSSRADLSDSGLRLGGANSRVTTILDEDNMASNSDTALATQQSIKTYVDNNGGKFFIVDDQNDSVMAENSTYIKFIGDGITTNLTDVTPGSEADPLDLTFTINAAQTGITSILATDLKIGEDDQTKIDFETPDEIHFYAANAEQVYVADGIFGPQTDSDVDLGTSTHRFKDAYVDSVTVTSDVVVGGNLTVQGTTTTIDTANLLVEDSLIEIARGDAGARASNAGAGLYISGSNITKDISLTAAADGGRLKVSGSTAGFDVQVGGDYAINGSSVLSADGAVKVQSGVAGAGLAHSAGVLSVDVSEFSAVTPAASDSFLTLDSDGSTEQRTTTDALATLFAGAGLAASSAVMAIDISEFSEVAPAASDALLTLDSDGSTEQLTTTDALASLFAGAGLTASSAVIAVANATNGGIAVAADDIKVDIDDLAAVTTIASGDTFAMAQQAESGDPTKKITFDNMAAKLGGAGLTPTAGVLAVVNATNGGIAVAADDIKVDIDDLAAVTAIASGDTFAIAQQAESGDPTKKITFDNMAAKLAGDGLAASAGVIAVQSVQRTFHSASATVTTGAAANFTDNYDTEIVQASFHVYLNGMLQTRSGSLDDTHTVFDYTVAGTKLQLASEMDSDDVLVVSYIKKG